MTNDVTPLPKPERRNKSGHERGCPCRSCIGRRNRRKGLEKQRAALKAVGVKSQRWGDMGNEETAPRNGLAAYLRFESKAGKMPKFIEHAIEQCERARSIGDLRPSALLLTMEGSTKPYLLVAAEDIMNVIASQGPDARAAIRIFTRQIAEAAQEIEGLTRR